MSIRGWLLLLFLAHAWARAGPRAKHSRTAFAAFHFREMEFLCGETANPLILVAAVPDATASQLTRSALRKAFLEKRCLSETLRRDRGRRRQPEFFCRLRTRVGASRRHAVR